MEICLTDDQFAAYPGVSVFQIARDVDSMGVVFLLGHEVLALVSSVQNVSESAKFA
jgi:hypothetical protein